MMTAFKIYGWVLLWSYCLIIFVCACGSIKLNRTGGITCVPAQEQIKRMVLINLKTRRIRNQRPFVIGILQPIIIPWSAAHPCWRTTGAQPPIGPGKVAFLGCGRHSRIVDVHSAPIVVKLLVWASDIAMGRIITIDPFIVKRKDIPCCRLPYQGQQ